MAEKTFWAGIIQGRIDIREVDTGWGGWGTGYTRMPMLFANRDLAQKEYEKIVRVKIEIIE